MLCPWNNTKDCENTAINEELVIEAINTLKGNKNMKTMKMESIKVTRGFLKSTPNERKMQECREYYSEHKEQMKPITVDYKGVLRDGYIQYLILKENGIEDAIIVRKKYKKVKNKREISSYKESGTTYIYGIHPNSKNKKCYVWCVPISWNDWVENIEIGDMIFCQTKYGISPAIVQEVEFLSKPPVEFRVKRVAKREIRRNGEGV